MAKYLHTSVTGICRLRPAAFVRDTSYSSIPTSLHPSVYPNPPGPCPSSCAQEKSRTSRALCQPNHNPNLQCRAFRLCSSTDLHARLSLWTSCILQHLCGSRPLAFPASSKWSYPHNRGYKDIHLGLPTKTGSCSSHTIPRTSWPHDHRSFCNPSGGEDDPI